MKYTILTLFILPFFASAQIKYPKAFKLLQGDSPVGRDSYYTDGKYKIFGDTPFQADGIPSTDMEIKQNLANSYGISFWKTKDGLFWGTGYSNNGFKYIIVVKGIAFILSSRVNDTGFANYSKWLLKAIRSEIEKGNELSFPSKN